MLQAQPDFAQRFARFKDRYELEPASYQIRNDDGSPGGWISKVDVWENESDSSTISPLWPTGPKVYNSAAEANAAAIWGGLQWLEDGRPAVKRVS